MFIRIGNPIIHYSWVATISRGMLANVGYLELPSKSDLVAFVIDLLSGWLLLRHKANANELML